MCQLINIIIVVVVIIIIIVVVVYVVFNWQRIPYNFVLCGRSETMKLLFPWIIKLQN